MSYECKNYWTCEKDYRWSPSTCICEITDTSVIMYDEIATNMSINSDDEKVRHKNDCYIWPRVLLVTILLSIITIICYHYVKHKSTQKSIDALRK